MLQFFSASTNIVNSKRAITECLENALRNEPNMDCDLIIIYSAIGHNFKDLLSEARKLSPGARIAGCTCGGIIGKEGSSESMTALAIMVIKGPASEFAMVSRKAIMGGDAVDVAAEMAEELKDKNPGIRFIQFLPPMFFWIPYDKVLQSIKAVFGPKIAIFGCVAMDNTKGINCYQFFDDQVIERGSVMIGYADPELKFISRNNHGFSVIEGMPFKITRSESNRIYELNNKPAWPLITETLGVPPTSGWIDVLIITALATELPVELQEEYGSKYILTAAVGINDDNSFNTITTVKEGDTIWLTKRDEKMMFEGVDWMIEKVLKSLNGKKPVAVFHADCGLRGKFSLNQILKDEMIHRLQYPLCQGENIPWLGAYSAGEFAMLGGETWYHALSSSLFVIYR